MAFLRISSCQILTLSLLLFLTDWVHCRGFDRSMSQEVENVKEYFGDIEEGHLVNEQSDDFEPAQHQLRKRRSNSEIELFCSTPSSQTVTFGMLFFKSYSGVTTQEIRSYKTTFSKILQLPKKQLDFQPKYIINGDVYCSVTPSNEWKYEKYVALGDGPFFSTHYTGLFMLLQVNLGCKDKSKIRRIIKKFQELSQYKAFSRITHLKVITWMVIQWQRNPKLTSTKQPVTTASPVPTTSQSSLVICTQKDQYDYVINFGMLFCLDFRAISQKKLRKYISILSDKFDIPASKIRLIQKYVTLNNLYELDVPGQTCKRKRIVLKGRGDVADRDRRSYLGIYTLMVTTFSCDDRNRILSLLNVVRKATAEDELYDILDSHVLGWVVTECQNEKKTSTASPTTQQWTTVAPKTTATTTEQTDKPETTVSSSVVTTSPVPTTSQSSLVICTQKDQYDYVINFGMVFCLDFRAISQKKLRKYISILSDKLDIPASKIRLIQKYVTLNNLYELDVPGQTCKRKRIVLKGRGDVSDRDRRSYLGIYTLMVTTFSCDDRNRILSLLNVVRKATAEDELYDILDSHVLGWVVTECQNEKKTSTASPTTQQWTTVAPKTTATTTEQTDKPETTVSSSVVTTSPVPTTSQSSLVICTQKDQYDYVINFGMVFCLDFRAISQKKLRKYISILSDKLDIPASKIRLIQKYVTLNNLYELDVPGQTCKRKRIVLKGRGDVSDRDRRSYLGIYTLMVTTFRCDERNRILSLLNVIRKATAEDELYDILDSHVLGWVVTECQNEKKTSTASPTTQQLTTVAPKTTATTTEQTDKPETTMSSSVVTTSPVPTTSQSSLVICTQKDQYDYVINFGMVFCLDFRAISQKKLRKYISILSDKFDITASKIRLIQKYVTLNNLYELDVPGQTCKRKRIVLKGRGDVSDRDRRSYLGIYTLMVTTFTCDERNRILSLLNVVRKATAEDELYDILDSHVLGWVVTECQNEKKTSTASPTTQQWTTVAPKTTATTTEQTDKPETTVSSSVVTTSPVPTTSQSSLVICTQKDQYDYVINFGMVFCLDFRAISQKKLRKYISILSDKLDIPASKIRLIQKYVTLNNLYELDVPGQTCKRKRIVLKGRGDVSDRDRRSYLGIYTLMVTTFRCDERNRILSLLNVIRKATAEDELYDILDSHVLGWVVTECQNEKKTSTASPTTQQLTTVAPKTTATTTEQTDKPETTVSSSVVTTSPVPTTSQSSLVICTQKDQYDYVINFGMVFCLDFRAISQKKLRKYISILSDKFDIPASKIRLIQKYVTLNNLYELDVPGQTCKRKRIVLKGRGDVSDRDRRSYLGIYTLMVTTFSCDERNRILSLLNVVRKATAEDELYDILDSHVLGWVLTECRNPKVKQSTPPASSSSPLTQTSTTSPVTSGVTLSTSPSSTDVITTKKTVSTTPSPLCGILFCMTTDSNNYAVSFGMIFKLEYSRLSSREISGYIKTLSNLFKIPEKDVFLSPKIVTEKNLFEASHPSKQCLTKGIICKGRSETSSKLNGVAYTQMVTILPCNQKRHIINVINTVQRRSRDDELYNILQADVISWVFMECKGPSVTTTSSPVTTGDDVTPTTFPISTDGDATTNAPTKEPTTVDNGGGVSTAKSSPVTTGDDVTPTTFPISTDGDATTNAPTKEPTTVDNGGEVSTAKSSPVTTGDDVTPTTFPISTDEDATTNAPTKEPTTVDNGGGVSTAKSLPVTTGDDVTPTTFPISTDGDATTNAPTKEPTTVDNGGGVSTAKSSPVTTGDDVTPTTFPISTDGDATTNAPTKEPTTVDNGGEVSTAKSSPVTTGDDVTPTTFPISTDGDATTNAPTKEPTTVDNGGGVSTAKSSPVTTGDDVTPTTFPISTDEDATTNAPTKEPTTVDNGGGVSTAKSLPVTTGDNVTPTTFPISTDGDATTNAPTKEPTTVDNGGGVSTAKSSPVTTGDDVTPTTFPISTDGDATTNAPTKEPTTVDNGGGVSTAKSSPVTTGDDVTPTTFPISTDGDATTNAPTKEPTTVDNGGGVSTAKSSPVTTGDDVTPTTFPISTDGDATTNAPTKEPTTVDNGGGVSTAKSSPVTTGDDVTPTTFPISTDGDATTNAPTKEPTTVDNGGGVSTAKSSPVTTGDDVTPTTFPISTDGDATTNAPTKEPTTVDNGGGVSTAKSSPVTTGDDVTPTTMVVSTDGDATTSPTNTKPSSTYTSVTTQGPTLVSSTVDYPDATSSPTGSVTTDGQVRLTTLGTSHELTTERSSTTTTTTQTGRTTSPVMPSTTDSSDPTPTSVSETTSPKLTSTLTPTRRTTANSISTTDSDRTTRGMTVTSEAVTAYPDTSTPASTLSTVSEPASTSRPTSTSQPPTKPDSTTETPVSTSPKPGSTTSKPDSTTLKPESTTERPDSTTSKPESTPETPYSTTPKPVSTTEKPDLTTETPVSTSPKPGSTTSKPESTTERPDTTSSPITSVSTRDISTVSEPMSTLYPSSTLPLTTVTDHPVTTDQVTSVSTLPSVPTDEPTTSSGVPTDEPSTPTSSSRSPSTTRGTTICRAPQILNPIPLLSIEPGQLFQFVIPNNTIYDEQDGSLAKLTSIVVPVNIPAKSRCWYRYTPRSRGLEFFPDSTIKSELGSKQSRFQLIVINSCGGRKIHDFFVAINETKSICFEIKVEIKTLFGYQCTLNVVNDFVQRLTSFYNLTDSNQVIVTSYYTSSHDSRLVTLKFSLRADVLSCLLCSSNRVNNFTEPLLYPNGTIKQDAVMFFGPRMLIENVTAVTFTTCGIKSPPKSTSPEDDDGIPIWIYFLIAGIFLLALLLILLFYFCRRCKCCKTFCAKFIGGGAAVGETYDRREYRKQSHTALAEFQDASHYPYTGQRHLQGPPPSFKFDSASLSSAEDVYFYSSRKNSTAPLSGNEVIPMFDIPVYRGAFEKSSLQFNSISEASHKVVKHDHSADVVIKNHNIPSNIQTTNIVIDQTQGNSEFPLKSIETVYYNNSWGENGNGGSSHKKAEIVEDQFNSDAVIPLSDVRVNVSQEYATVHKHNHAQRNEEEINQGQHDGELDHEGSWAPVSNNSNASIENNFSSHSKASTTISHNNLQSSEYHLAMATGVSAAGKISRDSDNERYDSSSLTSVSSTETMKPLLKRKGGFRFGNRVSKTETNINNSNAKSETILTASKSNSRRVSNDISTKEQASSKGDFAIAGPSLANIFSFDTDEQGKAGFAEDKKVLKRKKRDSLKPLVGNENLEHESLARREIDDDQMFTRSCINPLFVDDDDDDKSAIGNAPSGITLETNAESSHESASFTSKHFHDNIVMQKENSNVEQDFSRKLSTGGVQVNNIVTVDVHRESKEEDIYAKPIKSTHKSSIHLKQEEEDKYNLKITKDLTNNKENVPKDFVSMATAEVESGQEKGIEHNNYLSNKNMQIFVESDNEGHPLRRSSDFKYNTRSEHESQVNLQSHKDSDFQSSSTVFSSGGNIRRDISPVYALPSYTNLQLHNRSAFDSQVNFDLTGLRKMSGEYSQVKPRVSNVASSNNQIYDHPRIGSIAGVVDVTSDSIIQNVVSHRDDLAGASKAKSATLYDGEIGTDSVTNSTIRRSASDERFSADSEVIGDTLHGSDRSSKPWLQSEGSQQRAAFVELDKPGGIGKRDVFPVTGELPTKEEDVMSVRRGSAQRSDVMTRSALNMESRDWEQSQGTHQRATSIGSDRPQDISKREVFPVSGALPTKQDDVMSVRRGSAQRSDVVTRSALNKESGDWELSQGTHQRATSIGLDRADDISKREVYPVKGALPTKEDEISSVRRVSAYSSDVMTRSALNMESTAKESDIGTRVDLTLDHRGKAKDHLFYSSSIYHDRYDKDNLLTDIPKQVTSSYESLHYPTSIKDDRKTGSITNGDDILQTSRFNKTYEPPKTGLSVEIGQGQYRTDTVRNSLRRYSYNKEDDTYPLSATGDRSKDSDRRDSLQKSDFLSSLNLTRPLSAAHSLEDVRDSYTSTRNIHLSAQPRSLSIKSHSVDDLLNATRTSLVTNIGPKSNYERAISVEYPSRNFTSTPRYQIRRHSVDDILNESRISHDNEFYGKPRYERGMSVDYQPDRIEVAQTLTTPRGSVTSDTAFDIRRVSSDYSTTDLDKSSRASTLKRDTISQGIETLLPRSKDTLQVPSDWSSGTLHSNWSLKGDPYKRRFSSPVVLDSYSSGHHKQSKGNSKKEKRRQSVAVLSGLDTLNESIKRRNSATDLFARPHVLIDEYGTDTEDVNYAGSMSQDWAHGMKRSLSDSGILDDLSDNTEHSMKENELPVDLRLPAVPRAALFRKRAVSLPDILDSDDQIMQANVIYDTTSSSEFEDGLDSRKYHRKLFRRRSKKRRHSAHPDPTRVHPPYLRSPSWFEMRMPVKVKMPVKMKAKVKKPLVVTGPIDVSSFKSTHVELPNPDGQGQPLVFTTTPDTTVTYNGEIMNTPSSSRTSSNGYESDSYTDSSSPASSASSSLDRQSTCSILRKSSDTSDRRGKRKLSVRFADQITLPVSSSQ